MATRNAVLQKELEASDLPSIVKNFGLRDDEFR